jgi:hypothetical protein
MDQSGSIRIERTPPIHHLCGLGLDDKYECDLSLDCGRSYAFPPSHIEFCNRLLHCFMLFVTAAVVTSTAQALG